MGGVAVALIAGAYRQLSQVTLAIRGTFLPVPNTLPGDDPTAGVVAVRAAGGVALERCTPVFMYASLS